MTVLRRAVTAFLALKVAVASLNAVLFPRLRRGGRSPMREDAAVLVPARDEERNLPETLPGLVAELPGRVWVLDDGSGDATAAVAARLGATVLAGAPLPPGWLGKSWACSQLAAAVDAGYLVFTDADVRWLPGAVDAVLDALADADVVTVFPTQRTPGPALWLTVPLIDDVLLSFLPAPLVDAPVPAAAAANGQVLAFRRDAYERLGGHASVAGEVIEDVALARRAKAAGLRLRILLGDGLVETTMYRSYDELAAGFGKSLLAAHGGSRLLLAADLAWHVAAYTLPAVLAPALPAWRPTALLGAAGRMIVLAATRRPLWEAAGAPLSPLLGLRPAWRATRPRRWKGRPLP